MPHRGASMYSPPGCADGMDILYHDAAFFGFSATGSMGDLSQATAMYGYYADNYFA